MPSSLASALLDIQTSSKFIRLNSTVPSWYYWYRTPFLFDSTVSYRYGTYVRIVIFSNLESIFISYTNTSKGQWETTLSYFLCSLLLISILRMTSDLKMYGMVLPFSTVRNISMYGRYVRM